MNLDSAPASPNDRRPKLTRFLTQELLFEYISGSLHPARHRLVDEFLSEDKESQRELLNLSKGLEYAHEISRMQVSAALNEALLNFEPVWKKRLRAWSLWSWRRGWRLLPYAFGSAAVILGLAVAKPWAHRSDSEVTLAEQTHVEPRSLEKVLPQTPPVETRAPTAVPSEPTAASPHASPVNKPANAAAGSTTLRRAEVRVADFAKSWPLIRDKILALEGKAAGNVDLGWLRRRDESYFHFEVPEAHFDEFERFLGTFGPVQIRREKSSRMMPPGQIRIILLVKDGGTNEGKAPTETP